MKVMDQSCFKKQKIKKQKGGAAVETVVLLLVMVPLFSGLHLLGKISDVNNTTIQSSRYLAWEHTVSNDSHKTAIDVTTEINNRFFAKPDFQIKTNEGVLSQESAQNPLWTGFGKEADGSNNRLVTSNEGMYVDSSDWNDSYRPSGVVGSLTSGLEAFSGVSSIMSGTKMKLEWKGLVTGSVGQDIRSNRLLPSGIDCNNQSNQKVFSCIKRSNTILVDTWNAENTTAVTKRTQALVPMKGLQAVGDGLAAVGSVLPIFHELTYLKADSNGGMGYVHADMVPLDRYVEP